LSVDTPIPVAQKAQGEAYLFSKQCDEKVPEPQLIVMLFVRPDSELIRLAITFYRIETL